MGNRISVVRSPSLKKEEQSLLHDTSLLETDPEELQKTIRDDQQWLSLVESPDDLFNVGLLSQLLPACEASERLAGNLDSFKPGYLVKVEVNSNASIEAAEIETLVTAVVMRGDQVGKRGAANAYLRRVSSLSSTARGPVAFAPTLETRLRVLRQAQRSLHREAQRTYYHESHDSKNSKKSDVNAGGIATLNNDSVSLIRMNGSKETFSNETILSSCVTAGLRMAVVLLKCASRHEPDIFDEVVEILQSSLGNCLEPLSICCGPPLSPVIINSIGDLASSLLKLSGVLLPQNKQPNNFSSSKQNDFYKAPISVSNLLDLLVSIAVARGSVSGILAVVRPILQWENNVIEFRNSDKARSSELHFKSLEALRRFRYTHYLRSLGPSHARGSWPLVIPVKVIHSEIKSRITIATDGYYIFVYTSEFGLLKIGTGSPGSGTVAGKLYVHSPKLLVVSSAATDTDSKRDETYSSIQYSGVLGCRLVCAGGFLFLRRLIASSPSNVECRLDVVKCSTLELVRSHFGGVCNDLVEEKIEIMKETKVELERDEDHVSEDENTQDDQGQDAGEDQLEQYAHMDLEISEYADGPYMGGFFCDHCGISYEPGTSRWFNAELGFDLCFNCKPLSTNLQSDTSTYAKLEKPQVKKIEFMKAPPPLISDGQFLYSFRKRSDNDTKREETIIDIYDAKFCKQLICCDKNNGWLRSVTLKSFEGAEHSVKGGRGCQGPSTSEMKEFRLINAVNCGGPGYCSSTGIEFSSDRFFSCDAKTPFRAQDRIKCKVDKSIDGTADEELFRHLRSHTMKFQYDIPIETPSHRGTADTCYFMVTVSFCTFDSTERRFNVVIDGCTVMANFRPFQELGGKFKSVEYHFPVCFDIKRYTDIVKKSKRENISMCIEFEGLRPCVSAIAIREMPHRKSAPLSQLNFIDKDWTQSSTMFTNGHELVIVPASHDIGENIWNVCYVFCLVSGRLLSSYCIQSGPTNGLEGAGVCYDWNGNSVWRMSRVSSNSNTVCEKLLLERYSNAGTPIGRIPILETIGDNSACFNNSVQIKPPSMLTKHERSNLVFKGSKHVITSVTGSECISLADSGFALLARLVQLSEAFGPSGVLEVDQESKRTSLLSVPLGYDLSGDTFFQLLILLKDNLATDEGNFYIVLSCLQLLKVHVHVCFIFFQIRFFFRTKFVPNNFFFKYFSKIHQLIMSRHPVESLQLSDSVRRSALSAGINIIYGSNLVIELRKEIIRIIKSKPTEAKEPWEKVRTEACTVISAGLDLFYPTAAEQGELLSDTIQIVSNRESANILLSSLLQCFTKLSTARKLVIELIIDENKKFDQNNEAGKTITPRQHNPDACVLNHLLQSLLSRTLQGAQLRLLRTLKYIQEGKSPKLEYDDIEKSALLSLGAIQVQVLCCCTLEGFEKSQSGTKQPMSHACRIILSHAIRCANAARDLLCEAISGIESLRTSKQHLQEIRATIVQNITDSPSIISSITLPLFTALSAFACRCQLSEQLLGPLSELFATCGELVKEMPESGLLDLEASGGAPIAVDVMGSITGKDEILCRVGPDIFATTSAWGTGHLILDFPAEKSGVITDVFIRFEKAPVGNPSSIMIYTAQLVDGETKKFTIKACKEVHLPEALVTGQNADGSSFVYPTGRLNLKLKEPFISITSGNYIGFYNPKGNINISVRLPGNDVIGRAAWYCPQDAPVTWPPKEGDIITYRRYSASHNEKGTTVFAAQIIVRSPINKESPATRRAQAMAQAAMEAAMQDLSIHSETARAWTIVRELHITLAWISGRCARTLLDGPCVNKLEQKFSFWLKTEIFTGELGPPLIFGSFTDHLEKKDAKQISFENEIKIDATKLKESEETKKYTLPSSIIIPPNPPARMKPILSRSKTGLDEVNEFFKEVINSQACVLIQGLKKHTRQSFQLRVFAKKGGVAVDKAIRVMFLSALVHEGLVDIAIAQSIAWKNAKSGPKTSPRRYWDKPPMELNYVWKVVTAKRRWFIETERLEDKSFAEIAEEVLERAMFLLRMQQPLVFGKQIRSFQHQLNQIAEQTNKIRRESTNSISDDDTSTVDDNNVDELSKLRRVINFRFQMLRGQHSLENDNVVGVASPASLVLRFATSSLSVSSLEFCLQQRRHRARLRARGLDALLLLLNACSSDSGSALVSLRSGVNGPAHRAALELLRHAANAFRGDKGEQDGKPHMVVASVMDNLQGCGPSAAMQLQQASRKFFEPMLQLIGVEPLNKSLASKGSEFGTTTALQLLALDALCLEFPPDEQSKLGQEGLLDKLLQLLSLGLELEAEEMEQHEEQFEGGRWAGLSRFVNMMDNNSINNSKSLRLAELYELCTDRGNRGSESLCADVWNEEWGEEPLTTTREGGVLIAGLRHLCGRILDKTCSAIECVTGKNGIGAPPAQLKLKLSQILSVLRCTSSGRLTKFFYERCVKTKSGRILKEEFVGRFDIICGTLSDEDWKKPETSDEAKFGIDETSLAVALVRQLSQENISSKEESDDETVQQTVQQKLTELLPSQKMSLLQSARAVYGTLVLSALENNSHGSYGQVYEKYLHHLFSMIPSALRRYLQPRERRFSFDIADTSNIDDKGEAGLKDQGMILLQNVSVLLHMESGMAGIVVPRPPSLANGFALSLWIRLEKSEKDKTYIIWQHGNWGSSKPHMRCLLDGNSRQLKFSGKVSSVKSTQSIPLQTWVHIGFVYVPSKKIITNQEDSDTIERMSIIIDGEIDTSLVDIDEKAGKSTSIIMKADSYDDYCKNPYTSTSELNKHKTNIGGKIDITTQIDNLYLQKAKDVAYIHDTRNLKEVKYQDMGDIVMYNNDSVTAHVWIRIESISDISDKTFENPILSTNGTETGWELRMNKTTVEFIFVTENSKTKTRSDNNTLCPFNPANPDETLEEMKWYHICAIYDSISEEICIYIDGQLLVFNKLLQEDARQPVPPTGGYLGIGFSLFSPKLTFSGWIGGVRVWRNKSVPPHATMMDLKCQGPHDELRIMRSSCISYPKSATERVNSNEREINVPPIYVGAPPLPPSFSSKSEEEITHGMHSWIRSLHIKPLSLNDKTSDSLSYAKLQKWVKHHAFRSKPAAGGEIGRITSQGVDWLLQLLFHCVRSPVGRSRVCDSDTLRLLLSMVGGRFATRSPPHKHLQNCDSPRHLSSVPLLLHKHINAGFTLVTPDVRRRVIRVLCEALPYIDPEIVSSALGVNWTAEDVVCSLLELIGKSTSYYYLDDASDGYTEPHAIPSSQCSFSS